ncbi:MAG: class I SAM-dependent methyltransferase, partial [Flavitalea sp.]
KRFAAEIINLLAYFKTNAYETKFLDFGMGWGKWCLMAKAFGIDSYGMELSVERIEYAKKSGIKVISWDEVPDNQFDFINTEQVFEHIPAPLETMRHLSQALKPNGIIKISVPNGNDISNKLKVMDWGAKRKAKNSLMVVTPLEHINCYRTKSIITMGEKCGLENVEIPFTYIGFRSIKDFVKIAFRKPYYKHLKKGDTVLYFRKKRA